MNRFVLKIREGPPIKARVRQIVQYNPRSLEILWQYVNAAHIYPIPIIASIQNEKKKSC